MKKKTKMAKKYLLDGSYTLEAVFIVPMILGIFYAFLFQLFYIRDQVVMNGLAEDIVVQNQIGGEEFSDNEVRRQIQSYLWLAEIHLLKQNHSSLQHTLRLEAEAAWNIPIMYPLLGNHFHSEVTKTLPSMRPEQALRYRKKEDPV